jgi:proteic killer suppression protein
VTDIFFLSKRAEKELKKVPIHIVRKLDSWIRSVEMGGLEEVHKTSGYHDEPLKGERAGQRPISLSKSYRAIYTVRQDETAKRTHIVKFVLVEEVTKHEY